MGVYPRVRGGTLINSPMPAQGGGLSPRARGNRCRAQSGRLPARSIPACAGERSAGAGAERLTRVYPRVRGGTKPFNVQPADGTGLSPRARGNHRSRRQQDVALGSIPACAGEPQRLGNAAGSARVYPRVRGGTRQLVANPLPAWGLSPRARGNPEYRQEAVLGHRSIPACAGEPVMPLLDAFKSPVYPRVRGGTRCNPSNLFHAVGLSPRARGNHSQAVLSRKPTRSIPACAGEP